MAILSDFVIVLDYTTILLRKTTTKGQTMAILSDIVNLMTRDSSSKTQMMRANLSDIVNQMTRGSSSKNQMKRDSVSLQSKTNQSSVSAVVKPVINTVEEDKSVKERGNQS